MQFHVLGPVEIHIAGKPLVISRRRERCLLAILLLELNRGVPIDRLTHLLWEGEPPEHARRTIHSHVSRLRSILAAAGADQHTVALVSSGASYRMDADPRSVDAHRFRAMVDECATITDREARVIQLRAALHLWRGAALDNAASSWLRDRVCADLEERRLAATENLVMDSLALQREQEILPELAQIAGNNLGRERLVELYMLALHRAGRRADALDVYARARTFLSDELGLDPGPALRKLHQEILTDQTTPELNETTASQHISTALPVPRHLPADIASFTGRAAYLEKLDALLPSRAASRTPVVITAITGTPGVGKTALAIHWAHRVADHFPDGQLYVNLRGFDPSGAPVDPVTAIRDILDALQVPPPRIPVSPHAQASLYRSRLAGRRILLLLDNASDAEQVRPLLPGTPGCLVVVTSRNQLSGLATAEGAHTLMLELPTVTEARQLLERRLGVDRVAAEPDSTGNIIARCGQLPLALAVVASRAAAHPGFSLRVFADDLHESRDNLDAFTDSDTTADARAVFSWSYDTLSAQAARLFRLLGLHPGPDVTTAGAASLAGIPVQQARELLDQLIRAHLINEHLPGRYTFHDLLRAYASELAHHHDTEPDRRAAQHRLFDHYLHTAYNAAMLLNPHRDPISLAQPRPGATPEAFDSHADALTWFATEHRLLRTASAQAASIGSDTHAWQLAWCLVDFFRRQGHWHDWAATHHTALDAARRLADPLAQALTHRSLASAHQHLGHYDDAHVHLLDALDRFDELGDQVGQAQTHMKIGDLFERRGHYHQALSHTRLALDLYRATGNLAGEAAALNGIGWLHVQLGDRWQAISFCRQSLALLQKIGHSPYEAASWDSLGYAHHHLDQHQQAIVCYQRALDLVRDQGDRYREADVLTRLGDSHQAAGESDLACEAWKHAIDILEELDHPDAEHVRAKIDRVAGHALP